MSDINLTWSPEKVIMGFGNPSEIDHTNETDPNSISHPFWSDCGVGTKELHDKINEGENSEIEFYEFDPKNDPDIPWYDLMYK